MNKKLIGSAALATILNMTAPATVSTASKEKCYGIAKADRNDCGNQTEHTLVQRNLQVR